MALVCVLYIYFSHQTAAQALHSKGMALARVMSSSTDIADADGIKALFAEQLADPNFAYGVVEDAAGWAVTDLVSQSVTSRLPALPLPADGAPPQTRKVPLGDRWVTEFFYARSIEGSPRVVRFAYWQPALTAASSGWVSGLFVGAPVVLLVLVFAFVKRSAAVPLKDIERRIADLDEDDASFEELRVVPSGEHARFVEHFNEFVEHIDGRLALVEKSKRKLVTAEKFLSYRADRYEAILQAVPDGILILDEDLKAVFVNQHVEALFRVERKAMLSELVDSWCTYEPFTDFVHELRRSAQQMPGHIVKMPYPNQGARTLGVSAHPLFFKKAATSNSGLLILMRDVSEEVAAKQSRVDFVGSLSHEIKAPLNTIGLYAQMLESNGDDPEFLIETHNVITREVERLTRLVHNLLSITQIEMGTFELDSQRVYLGDIVRDCIEMVDHGADRSRIIFNTDDKITPILVDKELLRIAISNLLTNALKYSEEDTQVTVDIDENEDAILLSVSDRGFGISPEDQARIFDKFYRSSNDEAKAKSGHGLGLSIAQEIVKLHHGTLTLESTLGEGSKFTIELWKRTGIAQQAI